MSLGAITYKTVQGDTWASVSWKMYGSMSGISAIIAANTAVPIDAIFPDGTSLVIPILDDTDNAVLTSNLPPWKS